MLLVCTVHNNTFSHVEAICPLRVFFWMCCAGLGYSVVSDALRPHGVQPTRLRCPWDFLGKNMSGLPCPPPEDLPKPKIEPTSLILQADSLPSEPHGKLQFSSVQFSRSVVSDSLRPHESQHARPPCPSPTPGVYSNSRKLKNGQINICQKQNVLSVHLCQYVYPSCICTKDQGRASKILITGKNLNRCPQISVILINNLII